MFKSLYGKGSRSKSNDGILGPNDVVNMFGGDDENSSVDDGIEANLRAQLGDNEVGLVEDTMNSSGLRGDTKVVDLDGNEATNEEKGTAKSVFSKEEAVDLQQRLDNLSDEQIEKVFAKMRSSLSSKMISEVENAIQTNQSEMDEALRVAKLAKASSFDDRVILYKAMYFASSSVSSIFFSHIDFFYTFRLFL